MPAQRPPSPTVTAGLTALAAVLGASLAVSAAAEETIFKKVEADGSVTFTDQPLPDAEITVGSPISVVETPPRADQAAPADRPARSDPPEQPAPAGALPAPSSFAAPAAPDDRAPVIGRLSIAAPPDEASVMDAGQPIGVMVVTDPILESGSDRLQAEITVDGVPVATGPLGTIDVPMPERGTHVLAARLFDMNGRLVAESEPSTVHVQKPAQP